jgi:hypothetical protein
MIKFAHFRNLQDTWGGQEVSIKGGYTACYEEVQTSETARTLAFTLAKCNNHENFNKKIGRAVSEGRLKAGKGVQTLQLEEGQSAYDAILETL